MPFLQLLAYYWLYPPATYAQSIITNLTGCDFQSGKLTASCLPIFIGHVIAVITGTIGGFFVINVMIAGYQIALGSATGSDQSKGKERLWWSVIGLFVSLLSYVILNVIFSVLTGTN